MSISDWRRSAEEMALDFRLEFRGKYAGRALSVTFRSNKTAWIQFIGNQSSWTILEEEDLRTLLRALIERFPLDALGGV